MGLYMMNHNFNLKFLKLEHCESKLTYHVKQAYISHQDVVHQFEKCLMW
jgi:hypothetical protein